MLLGSIWNWARFGIPEVDLGFDLGSIWGRLDRFGAPGLDLELIWGQLGRSSVDMRSAVPIWARSGVS